jgi:hypothetical protein
MGQSMPGCWCRSGPDDAAEERNGRDERMHASPGGLLAETRQGQTQTQVPGGFVGGPPRQKGPEAESACARPCRDLTRDERLKPRTPKPGLL